MGKRVAKKYVRTAADRRAVAEGCWYDLAEAKRVVAIFEELFTHCKGEWAGKPLLLEPWEKEIVGAVFGWKRPDGTRRFREAFIEIPRKNGKTSLGAGLALVLTLADGEPGAEVYSAAADTNQAAICHEIGKAMVEQNADLNSMCTIYRRSIVFEEMSARWIVLSADAHTKHGYNPHAFVGDEVHAWPSRELWDVLKTGMGARRQPMAIGLTTAGYDRNSLCWELHERARKVLEDVSDDPYFFAYIAAAAEDEPWDEVATWKKANPNLGVSVKMDYLREQYEIAKDSPVYQNTFRRLHLNQWTQQQTRWMDMHHWDECGGPVDAEALKGRACYGGLDLSTTTDLSAYSLVFPPEEEGGIYDVLTWAWCPEERGVERSNRDGVPYVAWHSEGHMEMTPGNVIDHGYIRGKILELAEIYPVKEIGFDPYNAIGLVQRLQEDDGLPMVQVRQGYLSMSGPTKALMELVLQGRLRHGAHPVLRWCADNLVVKVDPAGNLKPDKEKASEKIDCMVALIIALSRAVLDGGQADSVYEERGLLVL